MYTDIDMLRPSSYVVIVVDIILREHSIIVYQYK